MHSVRDTGVSLLYVLCSLHEDCQSVQCFDSVYTLGGVKKGFLQGSLLG